MKFSTSVIPAVMLLMSLVLSACSSSTSAVDGESKQQSDAETSSAENSGDNPDATENGLDNQLAKVVRREGSVENRGVYIKLLVNKTPVTNHDINRRAAFLKLQRKGGNRSKLAEQEMIEQALKLQESKRVNTLATDAMVDTAFANFAKSNRASTAQMSRAMNQYGVGVDHFKEYIKTQISWQRAVTARFQADTTSVSERDAVMKFRDSGEDKPELTEYSFQQIVFVVPSNKRSTSLLRTRRAEANAFRQRFTSCGETIEQAKKLKDVSVLERKRILELELPERWKDEVANVDSKGTTRIKETDRGMEFLAICNSKIVNDDRAAVISNQSAEFDSFGDRGSELSKKYLDEVKARATIIYQ